MWGDVLASLEAATALPAPRAHECLLSPTDGPRRQPSGFRWWVRKSSLSQECSSPAELSCSLVPTQGYNIHHLYNVTMGDKTWAPHKYNPISSETEESINEASPTKKEPNCLRTATISDTWGQSCYRRQRTFQRPGVWEPNPGLTPNGWPAAAAINCDLCSPRWKRTREGQSSNKPGGCCNMPHNWLLVNQICAATPFQCDFGWISKQIHTCEGIPCLSLCNCSWASK